MEFTLKHSGSTNYPDHLRLLVCGAPGSGKTRLALTAKNPLWIAAKPGEATLARSDVPYVDTYDEGQLFALKKVLERSPEDREAILGRPVDTLVIDTIDELQRRLIMGRLNKERRSEIKADDWNWIAQRLNKIFDGLSDLDLDIIYLCHLKEVGGFDDNYIVKPSLQGGFVEHIHGHVNHSLLLVSDFRETPRLVVEEFGKEPQLVEPETLIEKNYLVSKGTARYEWVNDKTATLPVHFELNFKDDIDRLKSLVADVELEDSEDDLVVDDFRVAVSTNEEIEEPQTKEASPVPGMSGDSELRLLLSK